MSVRIIRGLHEPEVIWANVKIILLPQLGKIKLPCPWNLKKRTGLLFLNSDSQFSFSLKTSLGLSRFINNQELITGGKNRYAYEILGSRMSLFSKV